MTLDGYLECSRIARDCRHQRLWRDGIKRGRQRWMCPDCGARLLPGGTLRGYALRVEMLQLFRSGLPARAAARLSGHSRHTVLRYFRSFRAGLKPDR